MRGIKTRTDGQWKRIAIFIVLSIVLLVALNAVRKVYNRRQAAEDLLARITVEAQNLEARKKYLEDSLRKLETSEGLEFELRKKLNVAEVGESVAIIVTEEGSAGSTKLELSVWQQLKDAFKNLFR